MKKKVLITGSAGYIGQHLVSLLNADKNLELYHINKRECDFERNTNFPIELLSLVPKFTVPYNDIVFDCVIHLAALVKVSESVSSPALYYNTNIDGTGNVLCNFDFKNFIFASTGTVSDIVTESSPYVISKRVCEDLVRDLCVKNNIDYSILRFYNVIGKAPFSPTNQDGLLANLIKATQTGEFNLFGDDYDTPDGTCLRDYVHVLDVCAAIRNAIYEPTNSIEHLAYSNPLSVKEIIKIFKETNNVEFRVNVFPRRVGDAKISTTPEKSKHIIQNYSYSDMLKI